MIGNVLKYILHVYDNDFQTPFTAVWLHTKCCYVMTHGTTVINYIYIYKHILSHMQALFCAWK